MEKSKLFYLWCCEDIFLKGSIVRGDEDEYSDVDMYVIVSENKI